MNAPRRWRRPTLGFLVLSVLASALVVWPLAPELGVGLVFGYVSERPVAWILKRLGRSSERWRWIVSGSFVLVVALTLVLPTLFAAWIALREFGRLLGRTDFGQLATQTRWSVGWLQQRVQPLGIRLPVDDLLARAQALASSAGSIVARGTGRALSATSGAVFSGFVVVVAWVTFVVQGPSLRDAVLPTVLPWEREREILRRTTAHVIDGVVLANLGVSVVQAGIVTAATLSLGIPNALVWGVASFALSFIPLLGTALVTLSAAAWLFAVHRTAAVVVMLVVAAIAGSVDNVLRPLLARESVHLPFLWMLVGFFGGVISLGPAGVLLGPLALSLALAFWEALHEPPPPSP